MPLRRAKQVPRSKWGTFVLPFGKYRGDTLYSVYLNDPSYLRYLDTMDLYPKTREAVDAAITHLNEHGENSIR